MRRWVTIVVLLVVVGLAAYALKAVLAEPPAIVRVGSEDKQKALAALKELLAANRITEADLPARVRGGRADLPFFARIWRIRSYNALNRNKEIFRLVTATYKTVAPGESGSRAYSFVFHEDGVCVLHSRDDDRHAFGDLTAEGKLEALFVSSGERKTGEDWFDTFSIYRIERHGSVLLFAVKYKTWSGRRKMRFFCHQRKGEPWFVELSDDSQRVKFLWSADKQTFVPGAVPSEDWQIVYPCASRKPHPAVNG